MGCNADGAGFGRYGIYCCPFGQGYKDMSPPTKELMKLTLEERIAHGGHKVLRWMMDNVYVRQDPAGNIKMDKKNPQRKLMLQSQPSWHLTVQSVIREVMAVCTMPRGILVF